jgi:hypothetical protein
MIIKQDKDKVVTELTQEEFESEVAEVHRHLIDEQYCLRIGEDVYRRV